MSLIFTKSLDFLKFVYGFRWGDDYHGVSLILDC
ncbi:unnamed protein product [Rodentolepis nana]|uniref:Uncharacterized protein n=1 Tax=Rodentolepis nana TaxID=102285 RepID=A0A3P7S3C4_RODNA|nr:unnamed protein product [Rodentolepis nana]